MDKFKVGDRVVCLVGYSAAGELCAGQEYTVTGFNFGDVYLEGVASSWRATRFDFARAPVPIRTVTRREIVPGTYGNVLIDEVGKTYVNIDSSSIYYAADLRAAASLFNELADVLDEQQKEAA